MATTGFDLVTPTATLFSGQAEMIVCKTVDGEIAFLADHEPFIGALDPCLVRVVGPSSSDVSGGSGSGGSGGAGGAELRVAVHGGFVEVKDNHVIMLADIAQLPEDIDVAAAEREGSDAAARAGGSGGSGGDGPDGDAEIEVKWAQARLEAARLA